MAPRPRKVLSKTAKDFPTRFALHLRELLDKRKLTTADFREAVKRAGLDVAAVTVKKWLSGERLPRADDLVPIGKSLGLKDYRLVLPEM